MNEDQKHTDRPSDPDEDATEQAVDPLLEQLRSLYDTVASEPLPERFLDLLDQLDAAERKK
ncbi:hypothetical protein KHP62_01135 [Rhodobacteraceae bacterium NNCM2]|nr:hypothetical protein [Coraliihabitans acroporae]